MRDLGDKRVEQSSEGGQQNITLPDATKLSVEEVAKDLARLFNKFRDACEDKNQLCQIAEAPILELYLLLSQVDLEGAPPELGHVKEAVRLNFNLIHDFGPLWRLDDWRVRIDQRLYWLTFEISEFYAAYANGPNRPRDEYDDLPQKLEGFRKYFALNKNGVPHDWIDTQQKEKTAISRNEIYTPIRLLGAEIYLLKKSLMLSNLEGFCNHVNLTVYNIEHLALSNEFDFGDLATTPIIEKLHEIKDLTYLWRKGSLADDEYLESLSKSYRELSACSVLLDVPQAAKLGLTLLEFNTEFSGVPRIILQELVKREIEVLVDPHEKMEGLGRAMNEEERARVLSCKGARLFTVMTHDSELLGFYVFLPNADSVPDKISKLYRELEGTDIIPSNSRYGWCDTLAVSRKGRLELARVKVNAHELLDLVMCQTALWENCDTLLAYCRETNASMRSLFRVGWRKAGYRFLSGADGTVPYEVLIRDPHTVIPTSMDGKLLFDIKNTREQWGHLPHYRPYTRFDGEEISTNQLSPMSDEEASRIVTEFARQAGEEYSASAYHGSLAYYLTIESLGIRHNIHQLRPRTDYWEYQQTRFRGPLQEVLKEVRSEMQKYAKRDTF